MPGGRHIVREAVAHFGDLTRYRDHPAQEGVLLDDAGIARGVGRRRGVGLQGDQGGEATDRLQKSGPGQLVGDGDRVGGLSPGVEGGDGVEDVAVSRLVEVVHATRLDGRGDGVTGEQHGAEQRLLGIQVVGRDPSGPRSRLRSSPSVLNHLHHAGST